MQHHIAVSSDAAAPPAPPPPAAPPPLDLLCCGWDGGGGGCDVGTSGVIAIDMGTGVLIGTTFSDCIVDNVEKE